MTARIDHLPVIETERRKKKKSRRRTHSSPHRQKKKERKEIEQHHAYCRILQREGGETTKKSPDIIEVGRGVGKEGAIPHGTV